MRCAIERIFLYHCPGEYGSSFCDSSAFRENTPLDTISTRMASCPILMMRFQGIYMLSVLVRLFKKLFLPGTTKPPIVPHPLKIKSHALPSSLPSATLTTVFFDNSMKEYCLAFIIRLYSRSMKNIRIKSTLLWLEKGFAH